MKHGAYVVIGGGGAQASAIANLIGDGWSPLSHRIGLPHRRILGTEMVMPDGEILRMGSLATGDDPFWGEGPGPDLRGMLRGYTGLRGCLGIVTRMAIKTLPFQPERLEPTGISPNTALTLPEKRIKWINFIVPSKEAQVKAMVEIGQGRDRRRSYKGAPILESNCQGGRSKKHFWELWSKENEQTVANFFIVRVLLIGFTSEEQMEYDERVLMDIMNELGGSPPDQAVRRVLDQERRLGRHVAHVRRLCIRGLCHRNPVPISGPRPILCRSSRRNIPRH